MRKRKVKLTINPVQCKSEVLEDSTTETGDKEGTTYVRILAQCL